MKKYKAMSSSIARTNKFSAIQQFKLEKRSNLGEMFFHYESF